MHAKRCKGSCAAAALASALSASSASADELTSLVRLEPGVKIVAAIRQGDVELEGLRTIQAVDDAGITIGFSWSDESGADTVVHSATRVVRNEDLAAASRMNVSFHGADPESFPGSTAIQTSAAVLTAIDGGASVPVVLGVALGSPQSPLVSRKYFRGSVQLVERTQFEVLLNGTRAAVAALHAKGTLTLAGQSADAEFWWLHRADNPLILRWTFAGDEVRVVRIDVPERAAQAVLGDPVAAGLGAASCRAELHGVYFDFGSATLLPASAAALERVAALLARNPGWQIAIEGHTDAIGADAANRDLSERRATAVRAALIAEHGVVQERVTARGFGEARPIDSNDTLEGRARNRRVELSRDCGTRAGSGEAP